MKQQFKLNIDSPCGEKFEDFNPTQAGGFCQSCQKEVIDFTKMSDKELIDYFKNAPTNTCGRFAPTQLTTYTTSVSESRKQGFNWLGAGLLSLSIFSILPTGNVQAQEQKKEVQSKQQVTSSSKNLSVVKTITGQVVDSEDGSPLPGANIVIKGTTRGTVTDVDGRFQLKVNEGDQLIILYIGYEEQEISTINSTVLVKLKEADVLLGYVMMGAVEVEKPYTTKRSLWQKFKALFRKKN